MSEPDARSRPPRSRPLKSFWKSIRKPLAGSRLVNSALAGLLAQAVRFIAWTNPPVAGSNDPDPLIARHAPCIGALWHGQHLLAPAVNPRRHRIVAMFSRSADAELNAKVAEKLGFGIVRGSGGRENSRGVDKGGARALIALKKTLDSGCSVAMIADIARGKPRQAGLGIITLAKVSGRPIMPIAVATSRRKVLERSWDKTTINLPFGRRALIVGEPLLVPPDADAHMMERCRAELTERLDAATRSAYALVDGGR